MHVPTAQKKGLNNVQLLTVFHGMLQIQKVLQYPHLITPCLSFQVLYYMRQPKINHLGSKCTLCQQITEGHHNNSDNLQETENEKDYLSISDMKEM
jgi:hypothetical protein